jgi:uncharacterized protein YukJ
MSDFFCLIFILHCLHFISHLKGAPKAVPQHMHRQKNEDQIATEVLINVKVKTTNNKLYFFITIGQHWKTSIL